jgi:hypothetical protein
MLRHSSVLDEEEKKAKKAIKNGEHCTQVEAKR